MELAWWALDSAGRWWRWWRATARRSVRPPCRAEPAGMHIPAGCCGRARGSCTSRRMSSPADRLPPMRGRLADISGCAAGYLIGSIPVGLLMGRALRGLDVREHGSGSMGTTNVLRMVGPAAAATTFALDVAKGGAAGVCKPRHRDHRGAPCGQPEAPFQGPGTPGFAGSYDEVVIVLWMVGLSSAAYHSFT